MCGGTGPAIRKPIEMQGLSPRVRGNHKGLLDTLRGEGSIPACAGEPAGVTLTKTTPTVYPRVCGGTDNLYSTS